MYLTEKFRVVLLRTGIVLGRDGGALSKMLIPFDLGLGGVMGSGQQWMPWIHVEDVLRIIARLAVVIILLLSR